MVFSCYDVPAMDILFADLGDFQKSSPNFLFFGGEGEPVDSLQLDRAADLVVVSRVAEPSARP